MGLPSFFRTFKPRSFNYIPRYYDEQKENLQERIRNIEMELGVHDSSIEKEYVPRLRKGSFRSSYKQTRRKANVTSTVRLLIILAILVAIAYYVFFR